MIEPFPSSGIDLPSPTLSARLRELGDYLAAPSVGRLTEEQRALALGIARRLIADIAAQLDVGIDAAALWSDWLRGGIPSAQRIAVACFARAEEHRWRGQIAQLGRETPTADDAGAEIAEDAAEAISSDVDRTALALRIADRRRFDGQGNPCIALVDLDADVRRALLLDVAAWQLARSSADVDGAALLGEAVRSAIEAAPNDHGIDHAAAAYRAALGPDIGRASAIAIARHDWPSLIALAAVETQRSYGAMAIALLTAEIASLPALLAPLGLDRRTIAPLEVSLAMLPARAVSGANAGDEPAARLAAFSSVDGLPGDGA
jgi:hypothetical protein